MPVGNESIFNFYPAKHALINLIPFIKLFIYFFPAAIYIRLIDFSVGVFIYLFLGRVGAEGNEQRRKALKCLQSWNF